MQDSVRRQRHRPCRGLTPSANRGDPRRGKPCPQPATGDSSHVGLGTVAEGPSRSSWPALALHPRGGHGWLSAALQPAFSDLGKIEKLPPWRTLGSLTSFKTLGETRPGIWSTSGRV